MLKEGWGALRSGHWPSLLGAWLHFEVSFVVWLLIGALSIPISQEFGLSAFQKGLLVGFPMLGGCLLRIVIGPLGDWAGAKTVGLAILALEAVALFLGWQWGDYVRRNLNSRAYLGNCWCKFCRRPAVSEPSVSSGPSRTGDGGCSCRK